jgi:hypothetical protein
MNYTDPTGNYVADYSHGAPIHHPDPLTSYPADLSGKGPLGGDSSTTGGSSGTGGSGTNKSDGSESGKKGTPNTGTNATVTPPVANADLSNPYSNGSPGWSAKYGKNPTIPSNSPSSPGSSSPSNPGGVDPNILPAILYGMPSPLGPIAGSIASGINNGSYKESPGFGESLIPVWGSGREAIADFSNGEWGWGMVDSVICISDVVMVRSLFKDAIIVGAKAGSHSWPATRKWLGKIGFAEKGQDVHHWFFAQGGLIGKNIPGLANQVWNLKTMPSAAFHTAVHYRFNPVVNFILATPPWFQALWFSAAGRAGVNLFEEE